MRIIPIAKVFLCLLAFSSVVHGQSKKDRSQFGLKSSIHTVVTDAQFTLGTGHSFGLWLSVPFRPESAVYFSLNHRRLTGYRQEAIALTESVYPSQIHRQMDVDQLLGFSTWDLDVSWRKTVPGKERWSWGAGVKLAVIDRVRGESSTTLLGIEGEITPTENGPGYEYNPNIQRYSSKPLDRNDFARLDAGVLLQLNYRIIKGFSLYTGYYQGVNNLLGNKQYPGQSSHLLSQFSIGVEARLF